MNYRSVDYSDRPKWNPKEGGYIYNRFIYLYPVVYGLTLLAICNIILISAVTIKSYILFGVGIGLYAISAVIGLKFQSDMRKLSEDDDDTFEIVTDEWYMCILSILMYIYELNNNAECILDPELRNRVHRQSMKNIYPFIKRNIRFYLVSVIYTTLLYDRRIFDLLYNKAVHDVLFSEVKERMEDDK